MSASSSNHLTLTGTDWKYTVFGTVCEYKLTSSTSDTGTSSNTDNSIAFSSIRWTPPVARLFRSQSTIYPGATPFGSAGPAFGFAREP
jgi:hypothetical protein